MNRLLQPLRNSVKVMRRTRTLTTAALLIALNVLLGSLTIAPTPSLKIGLGFTATAAMGYLLGPVPAFLGAGVCDIIKYLLRPEGPYAFGLTFCSAMGGFLYGMVLYERKISFWRVLLAKGLVSLLVNVVGNTLCLSILYGKSIAALLPVRIIKNAVALPLEAALLTAVLFGMDRAWRRIRH